MKKILRFLLVPVFVGSASLTVVACGTSATVWNQDILESAVGQMQNYTFKMNADLGLNNLPTGKFNDQSNLSVRNDINGYYQSLVETNDVTWDNPTVAVKIVADATESPFVAKYGPTVETRITLIAKLSYRDVSAEKSIVVKVTNELEPEKTKLDAVGSYLSTYLSDQQPTFNFQSLFKDGIKADDAAFNSLDYQAPLRKALLKDTTSEDPFPVIDVEGMELTVQPTTPTGEVYQLDSPAITAEKKIVTGTLKNLDLFISNNNWNVAPYQITGKTFKIAQAVNQTSDQIAQLLSQPSQSLEFKETALPAAGDSLAKYGEAFQGKIQDKLFIKIAEFFPTAKMNGQKTWDAKLITFPTAASNLYEEISDTRGYFLVDLKFEFPIVLDEAEPKNNVIINASLTGLRINLTKATTLF